MFLGELFENEEQKYELFIKMMAKDIDMNIVEFLFSNPIYRAMNPSKEWTKYYGIKSIIKERKPKDNPFILNYLTDQYLIKNGFKALRSNSIFVSSNKSFVKKFLPFTDDAGIYVIFPPKKFYFTWNKIIKDFFASNLFVRSDFDGFYIDFNKLSSFKEKSIDSYTYLKNTIEKFHSKKFEDAKEKIEEIEKNIENKNYKKLAEIFTYLQEKYFNKIFTNLFLSFLHFAKLEFTFEEQKEIFKVNFSSEYFKFFDNSNFTEAVKSGHEIMITDDHYYYIENDFFIKNKEKIFNDLKNYHF